MRGLSTQSTFTVPGPGRFDLCSLPVALRLWIQSLATVLEAELLPSTPYRWLALFGTFLKSPAPKIGFDHTTPFPTTLGPLVISASRQVPGLFRIKPVPAPLAALAVAGAGSWSR